VLNKDFAKTNADASLIPAAFAGAAAATNVRFTLAKRDPSGAATNGIIHKSTRVKSWSSNDAVKQSKRGGDDAWDTSKYLNIWVCDLGNGLLGYAQLPGGSASTDGVVVLYSSLPGGTAVPYDKGRTATHEVGHWLNLRHIWGDASCGNDLVSDTPTQQTSNYGCPTFPKVTCSNGPDGDMFMNYMDYTNDACMYMFSSGQSSRMNALFASGGARASLLTSNGDVAPGGTTPPPTVSYCASKGTNVTYEWIDYVKLGSITRTSGKDAGYYNGTATSTSLPAGSSQTINFSAGFASTAYTEYWKIYIDYNQDGDFADAGETVVSGSSSSTGTLSGTFTVPASAKSGATRLRVVMSDNAATTSCGSYSYGETEDYTVNITGGTARLDGTTARTASPGGSADKYTLYPNPATSVLSVARPLSADSEQAFAVRVYDLRGAEVRGLSFTDGQLDVSTLRTGIYLLSVTDGSGTTHQRFVKE
jgi:hypothetical protein